MRKASAASAAALLSLLLVVLPIFAGLALTVTANLDGEGIKKLNNNAKDHFHAYTRVTLITGDTVIVTDLSEGQNGICMIPADPTKSGQSFQMHSNCHGTYVIPNDIDLNKFDIELFNIDYLIEEGYHNMTHIPVIVETAGTSGRTIQSIERCILDFEGSVKDSFPGFSALAVQLPPHTTRNSIQMLLDEPYVEKIWLDGRVHVSLSESVPLIGAPGLWDVEYNGTGIEIAILDTGIDDTHPDLDDLDDDPNTVDPKVIRKVNFSDDNSTADLRGHGTHCAGITAGTGAASEGTNKGVAPGAKLWNVKVLNQYGSGLESWVISGIEYAAYGPDGVPGTGDEADIISMSLGGDPTDGTDPVSLAVDAAVDSGVVVVISAGNEIDHFRIRSPGVARKAITVGANDKSDDLAWWSSKGPTIDYRVKPDILAPGVSINSSVPYDLFGAHYESKNGTSMSAPHVAGAAALMLEAWQTIHPGWSLPKYVKNALISTAVDTGYNVYEQGGGRINVPSSVFTEILVDPATISFGFYSKENASDEAVITFYNLNATSNRILDLNVTVCNMWTGVQVDCAKLNASTLNINPNSSVSILLTLDTTVPTSIYSGKLVANIDTGETVHAIFGFAKLNKVTVTKVDRTGAPAAYAPVYVVGDPGFPEWIGWGFPGLMTDIYGNATFYVTDGTYHVLSTGLIFEIDSAVYTIAGNVSIVTDTDICLDERDTVSIDFNANKPDQVMAEKAVYFSIFRFEHIWCFPTSTLLYVNPTSINAGFVYSYYPEAYYNEDDRFTIDTPEWHKLLFSLEEVTENTTFVADYNILVQRTTDYKVAITPDVALLAQFVTDPIIRGLPGAMGVHMTVPQCRVEWLSPEPVCYLGWYSKKDPTFDWDFEAPWDPPRSYPPGAETYIAFGEHPFNSGAEMYVEPEHMGIHGWISEDTFGNIFSNWTCLLTGAVPGYLTVLEDGVEIYHTGIWSWFNESIFFSGTPVFTVIVEGWCDLELSTNTYTELIFTADPTKDYRPPRITMRPRGSDLHNVGPSDVLVDLTVSDESSISLITLEYSLDDGVTWHLASLSEQNPDTWVADLGTLSDFYVSLRANVTDSFGNKMSQTTLRGLYVKALPPPVANFTWTPSIPEVGESVTFNASTSEANGGTIVKYEWKFGDSGKSTGEVTTHTYTSPGNYTVRLNVTSIEGLWDIEEKQIQVVQPYGPEADFTWTPLTPFTSETVKFDASASLPGWNGTCTMPITEYCWDFGDGNETSTSAPIIYHSYESEGNYNVNLTVNAPGASPETDSTTHEVTLISTPVGGYTFSIEGYTTEKPLTLHIVLIAILAASFTMTRRKTHKRTRRT